MKGPKIHLTNGFLVFLCAYCVFDPYNSFLPFILSVGAHELGHMIVLRIMGIAIEGMSGALAGMQIRTAPLSYRQELMVAASGPAVNLLLLLLSADRYPMMALINGGLLMYNLIPIYPLDGGRILRSLLSLMLPISLARIMEQVCGGLCLLTFFLGAGYLCFVYRCGLWPIIFVSFLFYRLGETILPNPKITLDKMRNPC